MPLLLQEMYQLYLYILNAHVTTISVSSAHDSQKVFNGLISALNELPFHRQD